MENLEIELNRIYLSSTYTIGKLNIPNLFKCDVLEDKVRDLNKNGKFDNNEVKVFGETAIPYGRYEIVITYSQRFKRNLPLLLNVPSFDGIRIHPGNKALDTHGCLLVGINTSKGGISDSIKTFDKLFPIIQEAFNKKQKIFITIK